MDDIRLVILGAGAPSGALRRELAERGVRLVGEVTRARDVGDEAAVVLARDEGAARDFLDARGEEGLPAIVVQTTDAGLAHELREAGPPGWAIVPPGASGDVLIAAVIAAANGLASQPASGSDVRLAHEDEDTGDRLTRLTARERDVLELVSQGLPNKLIAARLGISDHTVKFHLSSIFSKLGVSTRTEAVRRGVRTGVIQL